MIISTMPTQSSFYRTTLFLTLLIWPLSAQSQTIDHVKDGKVAAEACASYLATGKFPTLALEQAGFSGTSTGKKSFYDIHEKFVTGRYITLTANSIKRGRVCYAVFKLRVKGKAGYDMVGVRALDDAFQTALVAKGYKKNVIKIEKGT
ncbi:hypothetical protein [Tateyamaria sp. Alg231-49]|uniref:hypothetical protein n=1 Tax=Tateyamaria sp. Alg231-49 TaxID=1922219 RepID=UPI000D54F9CE|nr:hypothetical protein [Tateyamaria sp. Alg231-49]